jgi:molybdopterin converting factor small subunit
MFAGLRERTGQDLMRVELAPQANVGDLRRRLASLMPEMGSLLERCAVAVDDEFAEESLALSSDSDIALLPPVSGGAPNQ